MKLHILSDVHLEFGKWPRSENINAIGADVTVLAGDIGVGLMGLQWALKIARPVIYVFGNHEFYGQRTMAELWRDARAKVAGTHVHLLENESVTIDGIRFLGCTLWTDFSVLGDDEQMRCMQQAAEEMTDYKAIRVKQQGGYGQRNRVRLTPGNTLSFHQESRAFLEYELGREPGALRDGESWDRTVVVSHHAPSARSLDCGQASDTIDSAYASNLNALVAKADLWTHGHTHVATDYIVAPLGVAPHRGRVVSNQRGYVGSEPVDGFEPCYVVEC